MNNGGVEAVVMNYYRHIDREKVQFDFIADDSTVILKHKIESFGGRVQNMRRNGCLVRKQLRKTLYIKHLK